MAMFDQRVGDRAGGHDATAVITVHLSRVNFTWIRRILELPYISGVLLCCEP